MRSSYTHTLPQVRSCLLINLAAPLSLASLRTFASPFVQRIGTYHIALPYVCKAQLSRIHTTPPRIFLTFLSLSRATSTAATHYRKLAVVARGTRRTCRLLQPYAPVCSAAGATYIYNTYIYHDEYIFLRTYRFSFAERKVATTTIGTALSRIRGGMSKRARNFFFVWGGVSNAVVFFRWEGRALKVFRVYRKRLGVGA